MQGMKGLLGQGRQHDYLWKAVSMGCSSCLSSDVNNVSLPLSRENMQRMSFLYLARDHSSRPQPSACHVCQLADFLCVYCCQNNAHFQRAATCTASTARKHT